MQSKPILSARCTGAHFFPPRTQCTRVGQRSAVHLKRNPDISQSKPPEFEKTYSYKSKNDKYPGWDTVVGMRWSCTPWEGKILSVNQGGAVVSVHGIRGFIPYGEIDPSRMPKEKNAPKDILVGEPLRAKIMQVNPSTHQCVLSERDQIFQDNLDFLVAGATVEGTVSQVENYGAFVSLEIADGKEHGIYGMIHKSEISWNQGQGPEDVVQAGDKITVVITKVELDQCRILLSLKQTQQDPIKENLDTLMPLDINTISDLQWENSGNPLPELEGIVQELKNESKVDSVEFGRLAEAPRAVSQDLELWLSKEEIANGYTIVSRAGKSLQEVHVTTTMSRNDMKTLLADVLRRTM